MANYIIPNINGGLEVVDPVIVEVEVFFNNTMANAKLLNLRVYINTPVKFSEEILNVSVTTMDYDEAGLFLLAQAHFDANFKQ